MRSVFLILLSCLLLLTPLSVDAEDAFDVAILDLEADNADTELAETLTSIVRNEALQVEKYKVVNKFPIRLSDIALLVGCNPQSPSCLKQVAGEVEARILIHGLVRRQGDTSYQIEVNVFDVANGRVLNRLTSTIADQDPVAGFRKEIEQFFAEQRTVTPTRLQVGASVDGARVSLDGEHVGVVPLERKGLQPGRYGIRVTHPEYQVWETIVELAPGSDERVWAQMIALPAGVEAPPPEALVLTTEVGDEPLPPNPRGINWGAWSAITVGSLALGGSLGFGIALKSTESKIEEEAVAARLTEARYQELYDRGESYELVHRILLGVGIVGAATGLTWLVIDGVSERGRAAVSVGPSGLAARWQF